MSHSHLAPDKKQMLQSWNKRKVENAVNTQWINQHLWTEEQEMFQIHDISSFIIISIASPVYNLLNGYREDPQ